MQFLKEFFWQSVAIHWQYIWICFSHCPLCIVFFAFAKLKENNSSVCAKGNFWVNKKTNSFVCCLFCGFFLFCFFVFRMELFLWNVQNEMILWKFISILPLVYWRYISLLLHNDFVVIHDKLLFPWTKLYCILLWKSALFPNETRASISCTWSLTQMAYRICINFEAVIKTVQRFCHFKLFPYCLKRISFLDVHMVYSV